MMRVIKVFSDEEFCLEASVVHARSQAPAWERTVSEAPAPGLDVTGRQAEPAIPWVPRQSLGTRSDRVTNSSNL